MTPKSLIRCIVFFLIFLGHTGDNKQVRYVDLNKNRMYTYCFNEELHLHMAVKNAKMWHRDGKSFILERILFISMISQGRNKSSAVLQKWISCEHLIARRSHSLVRVGTSRGAQITSRAGFDASDPPLEFCWLKNSCCSFLRDCAWFGSFRNKSVLAAIKLKRGLFARRLHFVRRTIFCTGAIAIMPLRLWQKPSLGMNRRIVSGDEW